MTQGQPEQVTEVPATEPVETPADATPVPRTRVFAYKGIVGIESSYKAPGLCNDPSSPYQFGFLVQAGEVEMSQEAFDLLKGLPTTRDCRGSVAALLTENGGMVFGWIGGAHRVIVPAHARRPENEPFEDLQDHLVIVENNPHPEFMQIVDELVLPSLASPETPKDPGPIVDVS